MIFVSGLPPFDPKTGELLVHAPFEQQAERCLEELKTALEAAGSDLEHVLKVNVLCVSPEHFKAFNEIYKRYFPKNPPARIFFCVPVWTGPFDIEIECIAVRKD
jgi:2-iminobutanoate/2-iminopropanoate deaminase